jgi:hypothetical protein
MCRNIRTLYNFDPPASGFTRPSKVNQSVFDHAVREVSRITRELVDALETRAPARDREVEAARARARGAARRAVPDRLAAG